MVTFHLVQLHQYSIYDQLRLEEALLRADQRNWCVVNTGTTPAIVMGISGKPESLLNFDLLNKSPVPVIRRFSGGGTVFVDENTCFITMICNEECVSVPCFPDKVLRWNGAWFQKLFEYHPFEVRENDYVLGQRKFGGNAQYLSKKRWLHHTSLLWDYDDANMDYLLMPSRTPSYRNQRLHADFLCRLRDYLPCKESLLNGFLQQLRQSYSIVEIAEEELRDVKSRPHRQATRLESLG